MCCTTEYLPVRAVGKTLFGRHDMQFTAFTRRSRIKFERLIYLDWVLLRYRLTYLGCKSVAARRTATVISRAINRPRKHANRLLILHVSRVRKRALSSQTVTSHRHLGIRHA